MKGFAFLCLTWRYAKQICSTRTGLQKPTLTAELVQKKQQLDTWLLGLSDHRGILKPSTIKEIKKTIVEMIMNQPSFFLNEMGTFQTVHAQLPNLDRTDSLMVPDVHCPWPWGEVTERQRQFFELGNRGQWDVSPLVPERMGFLVFGKGRISGGKLHGGPG